jgi:hypothetical protein
MPRQSEGAKGRSKEIQSDPGLTLGPDVHPVALRYLLPAPAVER